MLYDLRPFFLLLLFSVPLFFLNIHDGHSQGGDDYALYIKEAQNIARGKPYYQSHYIFNKYNNCYSPPQYPPGFPLLLAPVVRFFGIAIRPLCYFNTVLALFLMLALYVYFSKYMSATAAVCLAVMVSYSGCMIDIKQAVLSDVSAMLFVLLYLIFRNAEAFTRRRIAALILCAAIAMLIRTQSVLLLFAEGVYLFLAMAKSAFRHSYSPLSLLRRLPSLYVIIGTVLITWLLSKTVFYCPSGATGFYIGFLRATLQKGIPAIIRDNAPALAASITNFFHYDTDHGIRSVLVTLMESAGLTFCCVGLVISLTRRFCFDDIFFILVCGLVLYYPIHDLRYFFPAMAIVFYYCYTALAAIAPVVSSVKPRYIALLLTAGYLFAGVRYLQSTTRAPTGYVPAANDWQAFQYISAHVPDSALIVCSRPRLTTLYTDKKCMIHAWQYPMSVNKKVFDSMNVKYMLLNGIVDEYYLTYLHNYGHPVDSVQIATGYTLYTLH